MSGAATLWDVAILGPGPAGVAAAATLAAQGHRVVLIGHSRRRELEGLAPRARAELMRLGLHRAAASAGAAAARGGCWGGQPLSAGYEHVVDRAEFDRALAADAAALGIARESALAAAAGRDAQMWRVQCGSHEIRARAVIDARGRSRRGARRRGPALLATQQRLSVPAGSGAFTRIAALDEGWCWLACDGAGRAALQVTTAPMGLKRRAGAARLLRCALEALLPGAPVLAHALCAGAPRARAASAQRYTQLAPEAGWLAIGDAACAAEPLSGQGITEALKWAPAGSAGIHTWLQGGGWEAVQEFMTLRAQERFTHALALAEGFYRQEAAGRAGGFWAATASGYAAPRAAPAVPGWQLRPVLNGLVIERRRVAVTAQHPRGVWQLDRVDLARLAEVAAAPGAALHEVAAHIRCEPPAVARALRWLRAAGLLDAGTACV